MLSAHDDFYESRAFLLYNVELILNACRRNKSSESVFKMLYYIVLACYNITCA